MPCGLSENELQMWFDGEAKRQDAEIRRHVDSCQLCTQRLEGWQRSADGLRDAVDRGIGDVEPLVALQKIRQRIRHEEQASTWHQLRTWWADLWTFDRRLVASLSIAAALGALCAPGVVFWLRDTELGTSSGARMASVVVESMEFDGARAAVYQPEGSKTTIIWWEPENNNRETRDLEQQ